MATYYVATNGNNGNNGSSASPWATIQHAVDTAAAGDTIIIKDGTYTEVVVVDGNYTSANPLTIQAQNEGAAVLDGLWNGSFPVPSSGVEPGGNHYDGNKTGVYTAIFQIKCSHVVVDGLRIRRSSGRGTSLNGTGGAISNITLKNLEIEYCYNMGMHADEASNYTYDNCKIHHNGLIFNDPQNPTNGNWPVTVQNVRCSNFTIKNCSVHENEGEGIGIQQGCNDWLIQDCWAWDNHRINYYLMWCTNGIMERCIAFCTDGYAYDSPGITLANENTFNGQGFSHTAQIVIQNCLIVGCKHGARFAYNGTSNVGEITDVSFINNTFVNADGGNGIEIGNSPGNSGNEVANNIIIEDAGSIAVAYATGVNWHHNGWSKQPPTNAQGNNDYVGNLGLVNHGAAIPNAASFDPANYELTSGSAARGRAANADAPSDDLYSNARNDGNPDLGAFEYGALGNSDPIPPSAEWDADPIESVGTTVVQFTDLSWEDANNPVVSWAWYRDSGSGYALFSSQQNPSQSFDPGYYSIKLTVTAQDSSTSTRERLSHIFIYEPEPITPGPGTGEIGVGKAAARTTPGNQTILFANSMTNAPSAFLIAITKATGNETNTNGAMLAVGAVTANDEWAACTTADHNQSPTRSGRYGSKTKCVSIIDGAGAVEAEAAYVSSSESGITINWSNAPSSAYMVTVWAFDAQYATAVVANPADNQNESTQINLPFLPSLIIAFSPGRTFVEFPASSALPGIGVLANSPTGLIQYCVAAAHGNGQANSETGLQANSYLAAQADGNGNLNWAVEASNFTSNGFTLTTREGTAAFKEIGLLCLKFTVAAHIQIVEPPNSTGTMEMAGLPVTPTNYGLIATNATQINTPETNGVAIGLGFGNGTDEACISIADQEGANPSNTQSRVADLIVDLPEPNGSTGYRASHLQTTNGQLDLTVEQTP